MKANDFAEALTKAADVLSPGVGAELRLVANLFASSKSATVAATLTKIQKAPAIEPAAGQPSIADFLRAIRPFGDFAKLYAKPAFAKDLQAVISFLEGFPAVSLGGFVVDATRIVSRTPPPPPTLDENAIERHLRALEDALGDNVAFTAAYRMLESDAELGKRELAALAKRFTGVSSSSRQAALKRIWARHQALIGFKAKSEARAGRSAA